MPTLTTSQLKSVASKYDQQIWTVTAILAAAATGAAARATLKAGWRAVRKDDPPLDPTLPDTTWTDAIAWSAAVGVGMGLARMLGRRGAASVWRRQFGSLPYE